MITCAFLIKAALLLLLLALTEARLGGEDREIKSLSGVGSASRNLRGNEAKKMVASGSAASAVGFALQSVRDGKDQPLEAPQKDEGTPEETTSSKAIHLGSTEHAMALQGSAFGEPPPKKEIPTSSIPSSSDVTLHFQSKLEIDFFHNLGRRPSSLELKTLLEKTSDYFHDLFAHEPSFVSFDIDHVEPCYDPDQDPDHFAVEFTASVTSRTTTATRSVTTNNTPGLNHDQKQVLKTIAGIVNGADYDRMIRDYIWMAPPLHKNAFYQAHHVEFHCHPTNVST